MRERRGKLVSLGSRSKPCYTVGHVLVAVAVDYGHADAVVAVDYDHAAPAVDYDHAAVAVGHEFVVLAVDRDGIAAVAVALEPTAVVEGVGRLLWMYS